MGGTSLMPIVLPPESTRSRRKLRRLLAPVLVVGFLALLGARPTAALLAADCEGVRPALDDQVTAQLVSSSLSNPVGVAAPPGDTARLFIVEQAGVVRVLDLATDTLLPSPFLNISTSVLSGGELGLLGLAFHPQYPENGLFFLNYTRSCGARCRETVIARGQASLSNPNAAEPGLTTVLTYNQPYANHNGGQLLFDPLNGYLYIFTGDGGDANDPQNNAQNPQSLLGKILRLDVDVDEGSNPPYAIPPSNPFAATDDGVRDEIWALGMRNPWRAAFDSATGDLLIADVGQGAWEEIDLERAGSPGGMNYQWRVMEAEHPRIGGSYGPGTLQGPILEYPHSGNGGFSGCSITGGVVYRGCLMPALTGTYFFADYCRHWVRSFRVSEAGEVVDLRDRTAELNAGIGPDVLDDISSFGLDGRGEMYICDLSTKLFRIVPKSPPPPILSFRRGDADGDDDLDLTDAITILEHLFRAEPVVLACDTAADVNDDEGLDIADAVYALLFLFAGGAPPPEPHLACGDDPTPGALGCAGGPCASAPAQ